MALFLISYLAGALTIVSPCILPVLPFVFARADQPFLHSTLPLLAGMAATFISVATLAAVGGGWAVQANEIGRYAALAVLAISAITLLSPRAASWLTRPVVAIGNRLSQLPSLKRKSIGGAFLFGASVGLVWTPCAGPTLGLLLTGAVLNGVNIKTTFFLCAYAAGAATSLALAMLAGDQVMAAMKGSLPLGSNIRRALGVAALAGVAAIALGLDTGLLARISSSTTTSIEQTLLSKFSANATPSGQLQSFKIPVTTGIDVDATPYRSNLPDLGRAPDFGGAVTWLNSEPLSADQLRGKVVLVNFWTYSCINCIRTLPYVRAWADKYKDQGLVTIGVHAPEFAFEKRIENVQQSIKRFEIGYPIAVDNNFKIWRAFSNSYWPAQYFIDARGHIRHQHFGEGDTAQSERVIQDLLAEATGSRIADDGVVAPAAKGAQAAADLDHIASDETYLGYAKSTGFASPEGVIPDRPAEYTVMNPRLNRWGLAGLWTVGSEGAVVNRAGGTVKYRFKARDLHLVFGPGSAQQPIRFRVTIDGVPPGADHGADIDAGGNGTASQIRLYQLVRQADGVRDRTFEIQFFDPSAEIYAFTFG